METTIFNNETEGWIYLTDDTPDKRITLRIKGSPKVADGDYEPFTPIGAWKQPLPAAAIVYMWAGEPIRSDRGISYAREYLSRWPEGPQADPEQFKADREEKAALLRAASALKGQEPSYHLDMTAEELTATIAKLTDQRSNYVPGSHFSTVLTWRIDILKVFLRSKKQ